MKRARHKRIVIHRVAEHNDFGAAETFGRDFCCAFDGFPHQLHRIHIDAGAGAADIDRAAHDIGGFHRFGDGTDQHFIRRRHAFLCQRGKAADKRHADGFGRLIQRLRDGNIAVRPRGRGDLGDGCYGNALVHNRHAVFSRQLTGYLNQVFAHASDFIVDILV